MSHTAIRPYAHYNVLPGHALRAKGRPGGCGQALCECGARSPELPSVEARRRWHAQHKDEIREEGAR